MPALTGLTRGDGALLSHAPLGCSTCCIMEGGRLGSEVFGRGRTVGWMSSETRLVEEE